MVEVRFYGTDKKLKERKKLGFAIIRMKYDHQGNRIKTIFLNRNEKIVHKE